MVLVTHIYGLTQLGQVTTDVIIHWPQLQNLPTKEHSICSLELVRWKRLYHHVRRKKFTMKYPLDSQEFWRKVPNKGWGRAKIHEKSDIPAIYFFLRHSQKDTIRFIKEFNVIEMGKKVDVPHSKRWSPWFFFNLSPTLQPINSLHVFYLRQQGLPNYETKEQTPSNQAKQKWNRGDTLEVANQNGVCQQRFWTFQTCLALHRNFN